MASFLAERFVLSAFTAKCLLRCNWGMLKCFYWQHMKGWISVFVAILAQYSLLWFLVGFVIRSFFVVSTCLSGRGLVVFLDKRAMPIFWKIVSRCSNAAMDVTWRLTMWYVNELYELRCRLRQRSWVSHPVRWRRSRPKDPWKAVSRTLFLTRGASRYDASLVLRGLEQ